MQRVYKIFIMHLCELSFYCRVLSTSFLSHDEGIDQIVTESS